MDFGIDGNAALITAGTAGLGLASAKALADAGCDVAVCGRDPERLADARETLTEISNGEVLAIQADITEPEDITRFTSETIDTFGGLDHIVTSAGGPPSGSFLDMTDTEWYDAYDLLVMSVVRTIRTAHQPLYEGTTGTIVMITSRSVQEVIDDLVLSNSVRRAVIGLMKSLSHDFAPDVRVNAVLPGAHETGRIEDLIEDAVARGDIDSYESGLDEWAAGVPMDRIGRPSELGETVAWLSSEQASYINGAAIPVDGGSMRSV